MPILKSTSGRSTTSFFGGYLPPKTSQYIHMYCLAKGIKKTKLLRKLLKAWIKEVKGEINEGILFNEIVDRIKAEWDVSPYDYNTFVNQIRRDLMQKNIEPAYINGIIEVFKNETKNSVNK